MLKSAMWFCFGIIATVAIVFAIAVSWTDSKQPAASLANAAPIDVTTAKLSLDYHANEVSADATYKGRSLKVLGIVASINKDFTDSAYLVLDDVIGLGGVRANLRGSEIPLAGKLVQGQEVTVICTGGEMILGSPTLDDCYFGRQPLQSSEPVVSQSHKMAPIVDGPAYLAQKAEAELAKDQANSVERPGMAGQPHDDGNGIAVDPDTAPGGDSPVESTEPKQP